MAGLVDRATEYLQSAPIKRIHTTYAEFVYRLTKDWSEEEVGSEMLIRCGRRYYMFNIDDEKDSMNIVQQDYLP